MQSVNGQPAPVAYGIATVTGGAPPVSTPTCTPASGSTFPIGSSAVTCTATDAQQRTATCTFTVTVQAPPRLTITRSFLSFGDSMTYGENGDSATVLAWQPMSGQVMPMVQVSQPYPSILQTELRQRYSAQSPIVVNAGLPGEPLALVNTAGPPPAPARFTQLVSSGSYEVALIMEGANDLLNKDSKDIPPAISALRSMVRDAKSRGIKVVLATLPPQDPTGVRGGGWSLVAPFNQQVQLLGGTESVPVADVNAAFNGDLTLIGGDGLHPNQAGYQKIADTFFAVIKANFEASAATTTLTPFGRLPIIAPATVAKPSVVPRRR